ncbi:MAG: hypothetical protein K8T10_04170 [Candidatus Eremiobacteraeota bacterium]|nr:hypothetical protein [Candidatus Eremiobacteraeota bacterium]
MKKSIIVFFIILLSFMCHPFARGEEENEFSDVINKFYDSVQSGNTNSLLETMVPDVSKRVKKNPSKTGALGNVFTITRQVAEGILKLEFKDRQIKVLEKTEKTARIATKISITITNKKKDDASELQSSDVFLLKRIEDKWFIEKLGEKTN